MESWVTARLEAPASGSRAPQRGGRSHGGRNNRGRITCYHRGGGVARRLRSVQPYVEGVVLSQHYDGRRSARLALVETADGRRVYTLATAGTEWGSSLARGSTAATVATAVATGDVDADAGQAGTTLRLRDVMEHRPMHSLELWPGSGARLVRAGGLHATVVARSERGVTVALPSGEQRLLPGDCRCVLGSVLGESRRWTRGASQAGGVQRVVLPPVAGDLDRAAWAKLWKHALRRTASLASAPLTVSSAAPRAKVWPKGKAGRSRWLGMRPTVRGTARNPMDHPHGGGQGKTSGGRPSVSPWSKPKGVRTTAGRGAPWMVLTRRGTVGPASLSLSLAAAARGQ